MCLNVDAALSVECLSRMQAEGGKRTVWKEIDLLVAEKDGEIEDAKLASPYRSGFCWEPGWLEANGAVIFITFHGQRIEAGALHCYFNKPSESYYGIFGGSTTLMPLTVLAEDFIAAGYADSAVLNVNLLSIEQQRIEACFRKAYLSYSDAEMTVKAALEERKRREESWTSDHMTAARVRLLRDQFKQQNYAQLHQTPVQPFHQLSSQNPFPTDPPQAAGGAAGGLADAIGQGLGPGTIVKISDPSPDATPSGLKQVWRLLSGK